LIDADEIRTLEYVKERVNDVLHRLTEHEINEFEAMRELDNEPTVSRFVRLAIVERVRSEINERPLDMLVHGWYGFEVTIPVDELLTYVIKWIDERIEHYLRTSTVKESGGLMLP